jgi:hypothetical protein
MSATDDLISYVAGDLDDHDRKLLLLYLCPRVPDVVREGLRAVVEPNTSTNPRRGISPSD